MITLRRTLHVWIALTLLTWTVASNANFEQATTSELALATTNPVTPFAFPDPSIIRHSDNWYYAFATGGAIVKSNNLQVWSRAGNFIKQSNGETWNWGNAGAQVWAPSVTKINGQYVMHYALSSWGDTNPGIGVATATQPQGLWQNRGKLFLSAEIGVNNSIDPMSFTAQNGKTYLVWGSFKGIYLIELSDNGLELKNPLSVGTQKYLFAGFDTQLPWNASTYESAEVRYRNGYYYLFLSTGLCCKQLNSNYRVILGRSSTAEGPYRHLQLNLPHSVTSRLSQWQ